MATYKGIQGFSIQNLSADPSNPIEGQVWYNSTSNVWKVEELTALGAWASGTALPGPRGGSVGAGTPTAALVSAGAGPTPTLTSTFEYDGTSWTGSGSITTGHTERGSTGTQTSAIAMGNSSSITNTEEYDGSTWTAGGSLNTGRAAIAGAGPATAAIGMGGTPDASPGETELYDGTSWTATTAQNNPQAYGAGSGTQTAGLSFGGYISNNYTEEFDGATWTSGGSLITAGYGMKGTGTQTAALSMGGNTPYPLSVATQLYDGTSWSTETSMSNARSYGGVANASPASDALIYGGYQSGPGGFISATEAFTGAGVALTKTITVS